MEARREALSHSTVRRPCNGLVQIPFCIEKTDALAVDGAMETLWRLFPDHDPELVEESDQAWTFVLRFSKVAHTTADSGAPSKAKELFGICRSNQMGAYHEIHRLGRGPLVVTLVHSWALLAPAAMGKLVDELPKLIVHVDDHTDLMPTFLCRSDAPGTLRDRRTRCDVHFWKASSVSRAICEGTIHKGNFLTAYMLAHPGCEIVHVGHNRQRRRIPLTSAQQELSVGTQQLHCTSLARARAGDVVEWMLTETNCIPDDLGDDGRAIWLDIDLDYFVNRYNGDSDRYGTSGPIEEEGEVHQAVGSLIAAFECARWRSRVAAASIAVSPGFFPSEYWSSVLGRVGGCLRRLLE